jgi:predicted metal-dependent phosphotriesterase family hydrolase
MARVMTVGGPLDPAELGPVDAHDHLFLRSPAQPADVLDDYERARAELVDGRASGLRTLVELTPIGLGRRADLLRRASQDSGVAIVAATGYHRDAHYAADDWVLAASEEALVERMLSELNDGIDDGIRAGVIKGGASLDQPTAAETRRLRAIARAARASGAQVFVHTEAGTAGHRIVDLLGTEGLPAERITLAHLDRNPDRALHRDLLSRGVNLVYDTLGHVKYGPDSERIALIADMVEAGFGAQLMLGLDLGRPGYQRAYGGRPGLRHLLSTFVPALRVRVGQAAVNAMLVANPARCLAMTA